MHECPDCGQACDCDGDDLWRSAPTHCLCECGDYIEPDDEWPEYDEIDLHGLECTCETCIQDHPERIALYMDDE